MFTVKFPAFADIAPVVMTIQQRNDRGLGVVRYSSPSPENPYHTLGCEVSQVVIQRELFSMGQTKFPIRWEYLGAGLVIEGGHISSYSDSEIVITEGEGGSDAQYKPPPPPQESGMFPDFASKLSGRFSHKPYQEE